MWCNVSMLSASQKVTLLAVFLHNLKHLVIYFIVISNDIAFRYSNAIMGAMASQFAGVSIVWSTFDLGADQRKHQSSA